MREIDALIVRNLKDLDVAVTRLRYSLEKKVGLALNEIIEEWSQNNNWTGKFQWYGESDDIWIAASSWRGANKDDEDDYDFWFYLGANNDQKLEHNPNGGQFWLTSLCSLNQSKLGFRSRQDRYKFPGGRRWKAKIQSFIQELQQIGFNYEDATGQFFLQISIDQERLACAIENEDIRDALEPIVVVLDRLAQAKPIIDRIRAAAII